VAARLTVAWRRTFLTVNCSPAPWAGWANSTDEARRRQRYGGRGKYDKIRKLALAKKVQRLGYIRGALQRVYDESQAMDTHSFTLKDKMHVSNHHLPKATGIRTSTTYCRLSSKSAPSPDQSIQSCHFPHKIRSIMYRPRHIPPPLLHESDRNPDCSATPSFCNSSREDTRRSMDRAEEAKPAMLQRLASIL
jgi:hypothetical protein